MLKIPRGTVIHSRAGSHVEDEQEGRESARLVGQQCTPLSGLYPLCSYKEPPTYPPNFYPKIGVHRRCVGHGALLKSVTSPVDI